MYKNALKTGFYDLLSARDFYREATKASGVGMHHGLIKRYLSLQALLLTPIAPHWADYIWQDVLGNQGSIQHERFPEVAQDVTALSAARQYVRLISSNITSAEGNQVKKMAKGKSVSFDPKKEKSLTIFTAQQYPSWQDRCIDLVREAFDGMSLDLKTMTQKLDKSETKKAMPFVQGLKKRLESGEDKDNVFNRKLPFDEQQILKEMVFGLRQTIQKCSRVEIIRVEEGGKAGEIVGGYGTTPGERRTDLPLTAEGAMPGAPTFNFENIASAA